MRVAALGSGSRGNAFLIATDATAILVDAGLSARQLSERLRGVGVGPDTIAGIVITHEHADHTRGAGVFARRFGSRVFLSPSTAGTCQELFRGTESITHYEPGRTFDLEELRITPFSTVHDASDSVAITVEGRTCGTRIGIATDLGRPTAAIRHSLGACHFLVLEANHDEAMLRGGPYPRSVQSRIASSHGHLSNRAAASFASELAHPGLVGICLAHLSRECNRPELARGEVERALARSGWRGLIEVASQDEPTALMDVAELRLRGANGQLTLF